MVQGHGQLDHAQTRAEVPARHGNGVDGFGANLGRQLLELSDRETAGIGRRRNFVEQRGGCGHENSVESELRRQQRGYERRSSTKSTAARKVAARGPKASRWARV